MDIYSAAVRDSTDNSGGLFLIFETVKETTTYCKYLLSFHPFIQHVVMKSNYVSPSYVPSGGLALQVLDRNPSLANFVALHIRVPEHPH